MLHSIKANLLLITIFSSILLYTITLFIVQTDTSFTYRWLIFGLHIVSIAAIMGIFIKKTLNKNHFIKAFNKKELIPLLFLSLLAVFVSFLYLQNYPYVAVGDEVRDSGLDAMRIANGTIKNIFGYGNYNGYGEIIPVFASFFYHIFGNTVFTYRVPAALISCLDVFILYLLLRLTTSRLIAFMGACVLLLFPLHLFFARTELVDIFDSFWTSSLLFILYVWWKKRRLLDYLLLGTMLGVAANFHTATRIVALIIGLSIIILDIKTLFEKLQKNNFTMRNYKTHIVLFVIFFFIGFGPMILDSTSQTFLQSNRYTYDHHADLMNYSRSGNTFETLHTNYIKSLMVWFYEGTTSRYPEHKPILTPLLALLFMIGLGYAFFIRRQWFFHVLLLLVFILPFTNSAMTDWLNADHRLLPLLPLGAIFVALGISWIIQRSHNPIASKIVFGIVFLYLLFQTFQFFTAFPANGDKDAKAFLAMHSIDFLKQHNAFITSNNTSNASTYPQRYHICLLVSPSNYGMLNLLLYKEQFAYFLPNAMIDIEPRSTISDTETYVFQDTCPQDYTSATKQYSTTCTGDSNTYCPLHYTGDLIIHYQ